MGKDLKGKKQQKLFRKLQECRQRFRTGELVGLEILNGSDCT